MKYGNCLLWAISQYITKGGHIKTTEPVFGWWPHFVWSKDGKTYYGFSPNKPVKWKDLNLFLRYFPIHAILFRGTVKREILKRNTK